MALATRLERAAAALPPAPTPLDYPVRVPLVSAGRLRRRRAWAGRDAEALVRPGERVRAGDAVASVRTTGRASAVDVAKQLGVATDRVAASLARAIGEQVAEGDVLAERRGVGGLRRRTLRSPVAGRLSHVSTETGMAYVEAPPAETHVTAHLAGEVVAAAPDAIVLEGEGLAFGGVAGAGPAVSGVLVIAETPGDLPSEAAGAVLACGFALDEGTVGRIAELGIGAVVACGVEDEALVRLGWDDLLWPDSGSAGERPAPPLTIVLLAAGAISPPTGVWDLLRSFAGRDASALGREPGAAPELLVFAPGAEAEAAVERHLPSEVRETGLAAVHGAAGLTLGDRVRVLSGRGEGLAGEVEDLSLTPFRLASEVRAEVADVAVPHGARLRVPLLSLRAVR